MIASDHDIAALPKLPRKSGGRPHVISLVGKGGAGKTTTAIQLGAIAKEAGHSVLILDADRQASMSSWTFVRGQGDISVKPCRPEQVLDCITRAGLSGIDLVLIDNAPNENACSERIAHAADLTLVMTRPSLFDLRVAHTWLELCKHQGAAVGVVINDAPPVRAGLEAPLVRDARAALRQATGRTWGGQVTRRHAVIECTARGRAVVEMDAYGPAAAEFRRLWAATVRLLQKES
jgi:chromosome partitioning protein